MKIKFNKDLLKQFFIQDTKFGQQMNRWTKFGDQIADQNHFFADQIDFAEQKLVLLTKP